MSEEELRVWFAYEIGLVFYGSLRLLFHFISFGIRFLVGEIRPECLNGLTQRHWRIPRHLCLELIKWNVEIFRHIQGRYTLTFIPKTHRGSFQVHSHR